MLGLVSEPLSGFSPTPPLNEPPNAKRRNARAILASGIQDENDEGRGYDRRSTLEGASKEETVMSGELDENNEGRGYDRRSTLEGASKEETVMSGDPTTPLNEPPNAKRRNARAISASGIQDENNEGRGYDRRSTLEGASKEETVMSGEVRDDFDFNREYEAYGLQESSIMEPEEGYVDMEEIELHSEEDDNTYSQEYGAYGLQESLIMEPEEGYVDMEEIELHSEEDDNTYSR
ncbi:unnamed protein product [Ilex paraguariensis]|uniref:Uncharacterized protein n=1 Tax=Ilex paraguariensis TaxID=185542 RepID=A0ABC8TNB0_9AQUA